MDIADSVRFPARRFCRVALLKFADRLGSRPGETVQGRIAQKDVREGAQGNCALLGNDSTTNTQAFSQHYIVVKSP